VVRDVRRCAGSVAGRKSEANAVPRRDTRCRSTCHRPECASSRLSKNRKKFFGAQRVTDVRDDTTQRPAIRMWNAQTVQFKR
jgi:hypothetical protein